MNVHSPDIVNMMFGSHLYHLDTDNSDIDYKGIYLPRHRELLLHNYPKSIKSSTGKDHEKNAAGDIDREVIALPRFIEFAVTGETLAIDMLHCTSPITSSSIWNDLISKRTGFYSRNLKAFVGYVKRQAAKYGVKGSRLSDISKVIDYLKQFDDGFPIGTFDIWDNLPELEFAKKLQTEERTFYEVNGKKYQSTLPIAHILKALIAMYDSYGARAKLAESNQGIDWKAVSHALRAAYQAKDIYMLGDFEYPLQETGFLLEVKQGNLDYKTEVGPELERIVDVVNVLADNSNLPEKVNRNYWDNWLMGIYREFVI